MKLFALILFMKKKTIWQFDKTRHCIDVEYYKQFEKENLSEFVLQITMGTVNLT